MTAKKSLFTVKSEEERIVAGVIAEPLTLDTVADFFSKEGIFRMYVDFVKNNLAGNVDKEHDNILTGSKFIRTGIALADDPDGYPEGAWYGVCKIDSDEDWEAVKQGRLNGFSVKISTIKVAVTVSAAKMVYAQGKTEVSLDGVLPEHTHDVYIEFDESGRISKADVSIVLGHTHEITKTTATVPALGHGHRLILIGE